ncbi:MAG: hypothetical protein ACI9LO_001792 [Planctomycetota bacterium]|jgi:hypothetical protein
MHLRTFVTPLIVVLCATSIGYFLGYQQAVSTSGDNQLQTPRDRPVLSSAGAEAPVQPVQQQQLFGKIAGLQEQLSDLRDKFSRLQNRSSTESFNDDELSELPDLVKASLNQLPMEVIAPGIEKYTSIPVEVLANMPDQRAFVERLADVAMTGIVTEADEALEPVLGTVVFSKNAGIAAPQGVFTTSDLIVFAEFDSYSFDKTEVLVKWYRLGDAKVFLFKQMPIRANDRNFIWLQNENGIEAGRYQVEVYDVSQEMQLLSAGRYQVETVL